MVSAAAGAWQRENENVFPHLFLFAFLLASILSSFVLLSRRFGPRKPRLRHNRPHRSPVGRVMTTQPELIRSQPGGNKTSVSSTASASLRRPAKTEKVTTSRPEYVCGRADCGKKAKLRCSRCKMVRYCTTACQAADWEAGHKNICRVNGAAVSPARSPSRQRGSSASKRGDTVASSTSSSDEGVLLKPKKVLLPFDDFRKLWKSSRAPDDSESENDSPRAPIGLRNVGNSCFANSVTQCLLHMEPFANYFLRGMSHAESGECSKAGEWCPICETEDLVRGYYGCGKKVFSPRSFLENIEEIGAHFIFGDQEDAHDFLVEWLDSIQVVMAKEAATSDGRKKLDQRSEETSLIWQIFGGYTRGEVRCECGFVSKTFQGFLTLELQISHGIRSLEGALDAYTESEELSGDNQYKCDHCKRKRDAEVSSMLEIGPNVLMIALKRFSYFGFGKINTQVSFPETLDLSPYMAEDSEDREDLGYSLHAVIVHISRFSSAGHYIAFVKKGDQWFKCDDSSITPVDVGTVLRQNVYMLMYRRDKIKDHTTKGGEKETVARDSMEEEASTKSEESSDTRVEVETERHAGEQKDDEEQASSAARVPEHTLETTSDSRLKLEVKLPEVASQKEIDLRLSKSRIICAVEGKYNLDLDVTLATSMPIKCRFVKKTKTLKLLLELA